MYANREALIRGVTDKLPHLQRAQRRVALFVLSNSSRVPFLTATELAVAAGTSQSSVTRFVANLGFASYGNFTTAISDILLNEVEDTLPVRRFGRRHGTAQFTEILEAEISHLQGLRQIVHTNPFQQAATRIASSRKVVVAGFGAARPLALHVDLFLSRLHPETLGVTELTLTALTRLAHLGPEDAGVLFAVPRNVQEAYKLAELLSERGVHLLLVTDQSGTVLASKANDVLVVPITNGPTTAVPAAMLTLGSLLIEAVALQRPEQTLERLQTFEKAITSTQPFLKEQQMLKEDR